MSTVTFTQFNYINFLIAVKKAVKALKDHRDAEITKELHTKYTYGPEFRKDLETLLVNQTDIWRPRKNALVELADTTPWYKSLFIPSDNLYDLAVSNGYVEPSAYDLYRQVMGKSPEDYADGLIKYAKANDIPAYRLYYTVKGYKFTEYITASKLLLESFDIEDWAPNEYNTAYENAVAWLERCKVTPDAMFTIDDRIYQEYSEFIVKAVKFSESSSAIDIA